MPKTFKQVHSCLGMFSVFSRFVPNYSKIAHPLQRLLRKDIKFEIDDKCKQSFQLLKEHYVTPPILAVFNRHKETEVHSDACTTGFGAMLVQRQDDGLFHPVYYYSRATSPEESRMRSYELETLAIVYALKKFRNYLHGIKFSYFTHLIKRIYAQR